MNDEDQVTVVTMRCIDIAPSEYIIEKRPCSECGEMTWLSSSSMVENIDKVICTGCFYKSKEYESGNYVANVTEDCLENAKDWVKRNLDMKGTDEEIKAEMIETMEKKIGKKIKVVPKKDI